MPLPVNIDSTYADDGSDASVQAHQQHHDVIHQFVNSGPFAPSITGAAAATRYVGGTTSGAPASGTFAVGDLVVDQTGVLWLCVTAGSPGTWTVVGPGQELAFDETESTNTTTSTALVDLPVDPLSFTLPQVSRPVYLHCFFPQAQNGTAGSGGKIAIISGASTQLQDALHNVNDANAADHLECWARLAPNTASATYKIQMAAIVSGTFTLGAITSIRKPFFRAVLA
jgi:hypothetical protein